jgi:O-antigen ligase
MTLLRPAVSVVTSRGVWLAGGLLLFLAVLPFFTYVASVHSFSLFLGLPVGVLLSLVILRHTGLIGGRDVKLPVASWGLLVGVAAISALASGHTTSAGSRVVYLAAFGLFAFAVAKAVARGLVSHLRVVWAMAASAALAAVAVIAQFVAQFVLSITEVFAWLMHVNGLFAGQRTAFTQNVVGQVDWGLKDPLVFGHYVVRGVVPFMSPPSAGQFLMIGLLATVWLALNPAVRERPLTRYGSLVLSALTTVGLYCTYSRQSWVGAAAGIAAMLVVRGRTRIVLALASALLVAALVPIPGHGSVVGKAVGAGNSKSFFHSSSARLDLWRKVPEQVAERPVLGVGPGQYHTLAEHQRPGLVYYAHNVFFDSAVELGILGALLFAVLLVSAFRTARARAPTLVLPMLVAWVVANFVDDTLYFPRNGYLLAAAIALGSVSMQRAPGGQPEPQPG